MPLFCWQRPEWTGSMFVGGRVIFQGTISGVVWTLVFFWSPDLKPWFLWVNGNLFPKAPIQTTYAYWEAQYLSMVSIAAKSWLSLIAPCQTSILHRCLTNTGAFTTDEPNRSRQSGAKASTIASIAILPPEVSLSL